MGYLGRRIGLSQDKGDSTPGGADGAVGGGILDLLAHGYFERQDKIYNNPAQPQSGMTATGGVIHDYTTSPGDIYRAHIFTSSGTFNVTSPGDFGDTLEYLVVAGGGGGGGYSGANGGGGGGAGGLRTNLSGHPKAGAAYPIPAFPTSYTVTIGAGGVHQTSPLPGTDGSNSEFHPTPQSYPSTTFVRSIGGGGGGYNPATGRPGGSSGGGAAPTSSIVPGNPSPDPNHPQPQGNAGGHGGSNGSRGGGGGGGAGSDGGNASGSYPGGLAGYGGKALQVAIAGPPTLSAAGTPGPSGQGWYAGGGGGAGADETFPDSKRGIGGRGNDRTGTTAYGGGGNGAPGGPPAVPRDSMNGLSGTGGGGGGGREANNYGGSGGSGIVVVRYQIGSVHTAKASGGAVSFYNNKTIHVFTGSGTFSSDNPFNETCECVIIGGGAGTGNPSSSGAHGAGGGGAGAVYDRNNISLNLSGPFSFNVTIGAGGNRAVAPGNKGVSGSPSIVAFPTGTLTAPGGGAGGISVPSGSTSGNPGGAGGGASNYSSPGNPHPGGTGAGAPWPGTPGNDPGSGWGGDGGGSNTASPAYGGGGGGGAKDGGHGNGSAGGGGGGAYKIPTTYTDPNATYGYAGPGSTHFWFAGGGGGGTYDGSPGTEGVGGGGPNLSTPYGGSGKGGYRTGPGGESARANSGAGAGGGGGGNSSPGANGGSGIVLIAYPT